MHAALSRKLFAALDGESKTNQRESPAQGLRGEKHDEPTPRRRGAQQLPATADQNRDAKGRIGQYGGAAEPSIQKY
jgi:hypothetical protein